ncbi:MAG: hypothetical protein AAFY60_06270, partial [Myxococcota bacterium]
HDRRMVALEGHQQVTVRPEEIDLPDSSVTAQPAPPDTVTAPVPSDKAPDVSPDAPSDAAPDTTDASAPPSAGPEAQSTGESDPDSPEGVE